jgi:probable rRNA maturation factor
MEAEYFDPETDALMLGDIVLNTERIREQAAEFGHSLLREYAFLIAHSMLHLCGYDHMTPEEAGVMEEKQNLVMQELGLLRDLDLEVQMENLHAYGEKIGQE